MNSRVALLAMAALACLAVVSVAQVAAPPEPGSGEPTWDRFRVLVDRNIFLRTRTKPRPSESGRTEEMRVERDPNADLVLVGITRQELMTIAFIENTRTGQVDRAVVADAVGTGKITAIASDNITFSNDETDVEIAIGRSLGGTAPSVATSQQPGRPSGDTDTTTGSDQADAAAILERMRQRRQQELN